MKIKLFPLFFTILYSTLVHAASVPPTSLSTPDAVLNAGSPEALPAVNNHQNPDMVAPIEPPEQIEARTKWWREARFGMFIHWGLYSAYAGEYKGKFIPGNAEWIQYKGKIPEVEYAASAKQFNPVKFNAEEWVETAKAAGMKYLVITAKHHDGFAMYDTRLSDYNIVKDTPFKRDPIRELAEACQKEGIRFGVYYSNDLDWHEHMFSPPPHDGTNAVKFDAYYRGKSMGQVKELLSNYGPISFLWFDGQPKAATVKQGLDFRNLVRSLQPDCIINNRLRSVPGDFFIYEQRTPKAEDKQIWESCMPMQNTWGYRKNDKSWKPTSRILLTMTDSVARGGNFILNVGPTAEGIIPTNAVDQLKEIGAWMKVNGEAIYGCSQAPFDVKLYGEEQQYRTERSKFLL